MPESVPQRIAVVAACPFPTTQGSQVFVDQLARALAEAGHEIHLVTYGFGEFDPPPDAAYRIHRITALVPGRKLSAGPSAAKPILDGLLAAQVARVCLRHGIELIHAVNYEAALIGYAVRALVGRPVVYHSHGVLELELPTYFHTPRRQAAAARIGRAIERLVYRGADGVVALCEHDAEHARRRVRPGVNVARINPGVDPRVERVAGTDEIGSGPPLFAYTGNLDRYQGLGLVLDAFRLLLEKRPDARLVFATASEPAPLLREARRLGIGRRVAVLGGADLASTIPIIRSACAAVVPRCVPYGFPIKLLNYMAMGVPVIVCCNGYDGFADGVNALVRGPTAESFADAMERLAADPALRNTLAAGAARLAAERYSWADAAAGIRGLYAAMAGEGRPAGAAVPADPTGA